jgi:hypothetical protein
MAKYWIANNPNSEITDAEAQKVEELSATSVTLAELNQLDNQVASVTFSVASESGEAIVVSCQFLDAAGADMATASACYAFLSADSSGQTNASASGLTPSAGTDGHVIPIADSNTAVAMLLISEADGDVDVTITDASTGTTTNYLNVVTPSGKIYTSGAITFA